MKDDVVILLLLQSLASHIGLYQVVRRGPRRSSSGEHPGRRFQHAYLRSPVKLNRLENTEKIGGEPPTRPILCQCSCVADLKSQSQRRVCTCLSCRKGKITGSGEQSICNQVHPPFPRLAVF
ncbi:hypothetical protein F4780DRAFT_398093 [Xylariomycetidae sp. FL0641]|nr:hypothetical protein F4780DRAFT_398093 [Xylariomycetidae sp. FL0641]